MDFKLKPAMSLTRVDSDTLLVRLAPWIPRKSSTLNPKPSTLVRLALRIPASVSHLIVREAASCKAILVAKCLLGGCLLRAAVGAVSLRRFFCCHVHAPGPFRA